MDRCRLLYPVLVFLCFPFLRSSAQVVGAVPGQNINMVSGTGFPGGDPYLQRQNESSMAVSSRNPLHLLAGANDYRSVDIPFPPDTQNGVEKETGDAWVGVFTSIDGGQSWSSTLVPGYPQDQSAVGVSSPLHGFAVATDPTVRAGTNGLFYYSGLVFDRGNNAPSGVFVATFQDQNNKGNGASAIQQQKNGMGSPFLYRNATLVDTGTSGQFLDKPWIVVDVPSPTASATCSDPNGKPFTSGNVYVFYTSFNGSSKNPGSAINVVTSNNCGASWSKPTRISQSAQLNQGTVAAIDPGTGTVYVFWRQIGNGGQNQPDAILYAYSTDGGGTWNTQTAYTFPSGLSFDESSDSGTFREADLPTATVDGTGRVWLAFSQRNLGPLNTSRILVTTLPRGGSQKSWTKPFIADNNPNPGHQFMPAFTFAYGKLMLVWFDSRDDHTKGVLQCPANTMCKGVSDFVEMRVPLTGTGGARDSASAIFAPEISDTGLHVRHTIDVRGALVDPTPLDNGSVSTLAFPSVRISQYTFGSRCTVATPPGTPCPDKSPKIIEQMKFNPPNLPMFSHGTKPFIGDYIDVAALTMLFDRTSKKWIFNTQPSNAAVFHATWTDNRDVRPPPVVNGVQNWALYTAVGSTGGTSFYDPTQMKQVCVPGTNDNQTGSRNQNVYTSRITQGLLVGVKENTKPLTNPGGASVRRVFSLFARNTTNQQAFYRFIANTIGAGPCQTDASGTTTSFNQFSCTNPDSVDVIALPRSTVSRSLFVTSTLKYPSVTVTIAQINKIGGTVIDPQSGGLQSTTAINPDNTNPDITNPDITNPDITNPDITNPDITNPDITNAEAYDPTVTNPDITNPDITNPDITNPDITNPDITNPDITNPDITNIVVTNPDITNPDITNPDITNPDITNPDITNPDITNPDITSLSAGGINDVTFKLSNKGNTSSSYSAKEFARQVGVACCRAGCPAGGGGFDPNGKPCPADPCTKCQLIARKTYPTPIANACTLGVETQNIPISNIPNPAFTTGNITTPDNGSDDPNMQPDATVSLGPGEGARVTLRVFGPVNSPQGGGSTPVKTVGVAGGANTGQNTAATSLTITTTNLPVAVVGTDYQTNSGAASKLMSVGGVGTTSWKASVGTLPPGISLAASTGQLSGVVSATPGAYPLTFRVDDSLTPVSNFDLQNLTIDVNQLSITGINAANTNTGSIYLSGNPGDSITVTMNVLNQGPADATSVAAAALTISPVAGGTPLGQAPVVTCSAASGPAMIPHNLTQSYMYTCTTSGGNGFVTFSAGASAQYVNSAASVPATAAPMTSNQITVDTTPPMLMFNAASPAANAAGWNNTAVAFSYTTTDNLSGVKSSTPNPLVLSAEGTAVTGTVTVTDVAGNSATFTSPAVKIDKTPPTLAFAAATPAPNAAGWNNTNVSFSYTTADNLSGVASSLPANPLVVSAEGSAVTGSVTVTDVAGNSAVFTSAAVKIDKTPPTLTFAAGSPAPNAAGWNNTDVSFAYTASDSLSGVATSSPASPLVVSAQGTAVTGTVTVTDVAGNTAMFASSPVKIDKTAPVIAITAPTANQVFVLNSTITPSVTCAEGAGGVDIANCVVTPSAAPYTATPVGPGTITASAVDAAGNTAGPVQVAYLVAYNFTGFQGPLQAAGTPSAPSNSGSFGQGSQISFQWTLQDFNHAFIVNGATLTNISATPSSACDGVPTGSPIPLYAPPVGTSAFSINTTTGVATFVWDTTGVATGCYNVVVSLDDTTRHATIVNVAPSTTVTGSQINGFYSPTGTLANAPANLTSAVVNAFVPTGQGPYSILPGQGAANGTFSIPNVATGNYWFHLGTTWLWTNESVIDTGFSSEGRPNAISGNATVNFSVSNMTAWKSGDSLEYWTPNLYEVDSDITVSRNSQYTAPTTGATSYIDSPTWVQGLVDTSQGDQFFLLHLGAISLGGFTFDALEETFSPSGTIMQASNSTTSFTGSFTPVAQNQTIHVAARASQFAQAVAAAGPGATPDAATFGIYITTPSPELLFGNDDPALFGLRPTAGITADFDLGDAQYGDPFPANYVRYYAYSQNSLVPFMSPGATQPGFIAAGTQAVTLNPPSAAAPLSPVVGPVSSITINGNPFMQAVSSVGTTPTIGWQAPAVGSATDYRVVILQLGVNGSGVSIRTRVAVLSTASTSVQIPPGILKPGSTYLLEVTALHRSGEDPRANLFKTTFPYGIGQVITYQLTP